MKAGMVLQDIFCGVLMMDDRGQDGIIGLILMKQRFDCFFVFIRQDAGFDVLIVFENGRFQSGIAKVEAKGCGHDFCRFER
jgi:hypothetical protein